jgi:hypothetical protein
MHRGTCLCGSIAYELESDLKAIVNCHCRFCRKAHGAPFTTVLFVPFSRVTIVSGAELVAKYRVEALNADRCFCSRCGTRLWSHQSASGMASLVVATLDTSEPLRPLAHVNTASACSWFRIGDELPQFPATPGPAEFRQMLAS